MRRRRTDSLGHLEAIVKKPPVFKVRENKRTEGQTRAEDLSLNWGMATKEHDGGKYEGYEEDAEAQEGCCRDGGNTCQKHGQERATNSLKGAEQVTHATKKKSEPLFLENHVECDRIGRLGGLEGAAVRADSRRAIGAGCHMEIGSPKSATARKGSLIKGDRGELVHNGKKKG